MVQTFTLANISDISFGAGGLQVTATGDVTGVTLPSQSQSTTLPCTVVALQGQSIASTAPTGNQALVWNSGTSKWTPTAIVNSFNTRTGSITLAAADVGAVSSFSAPAHQWINAFSAAGVFSAVQPAFTDISGALASTQLAIGATLAFSGNTLETAALTGDVTTSANSFATTIGANVVTNSKLAQAPADTLKGNNTGATANVADLTVTQVKTLLNTAPQVTIFSSGSGTYTTPTGALFLIVELVGGGAGGDGSGSAPGTGTNGTSSTFGSSFLTAAGGVHSGGSGGTASGGDINIAGGVGQGSQVSVSGVSLAGGFGGMAPVFGVVTPGIAGGAGPNAGGAGSGGAGGGGSGAVGPAAAGSGAGYVRKTITSPAASYAYAVGTNGTGGTAGGSGFAGGNGSTGFITITAYFQ